ncbi:MAG: hypothetical protein HW421_282 [Ignavibacteria bacterium]|nr:hypothetical protein [Ignavibacteria bacterium]
MGRNDTRSLVALLLLIIFTYIFVGTDFAFCAPKASAQKEEKKDEEKKEVVKYNVFAKYPLKVYNKYKFTEDTKVVRRFSDSSTKEYTRSQTFFFTIFAANAPEDGFQTLEVTVDSMQYKFVEGDAIIEVNFDDLPPTSFSDFVACNVPLGKEFEMTYSPYGEVAKIEGEKLDKLTELITVKGKNSMDTLQKYMWMRGISYEHLTFLFDLQKGIVPQEPVAIDSSWKTNFALEIEGVDFSDTVKNTLKSYDAGIFEIEVKAEKLHPFLTPIRMYNVSEFVHVDSGMAYGTYKMKVNTSGSIKNVEGDFNADVVTSIKKEKFIHNISVKMNWELLGQYKW